MKDLTPTTATPRLTDGTPDCHRYANLLPLMEMNGKDFIDLVKDIRKNGLQQPIVLYESQILDGRNRQAACLLLGIEPTYMEYTGADPMGFVASQNLHRRNLTPSQKAMVAARMLEMLEQEARERQREAGRQRADSERDETGQFQLMANLPQAGDGNAHPAPTSREKAAAFTGASPRAVQQAKQVQENGIPDLKAAVETNAIAVSEAADIAALPTDQQAEVLQLPQKQRRAAARAAKAERKAERVKVQSGIRKEFTRVYEKLFSLIKDINWDFMLGPNVDPTEVARRAIDSFPYHNAEFFDNFLPHLANVATLVNELHRLNEARHECRDAQTA